MTINVTEERRAGLMTTQGFPRDLPEPPFSCRSVVCTHSAVGHVPIGRGSNDMYYKTVQTWSKNA